MAKKNETPESYESAMRELQAIIQKLQEEAVNIDDLSDQVKRAAGLIKFCKEKLRSTESELNDLL